MYSKHISFDEGVTRIKRDGIYPFFQAVRNKTNTKFNHEQFTRLYDLVFILATQPGTDTLNRLYQFCEQCMREYNTDYIKPVLIQSKPRDTLVRTFNETWTETIHVVKGLSSIFMYIDRYYTEQPVLMGRLTATPVSIRKLGYNVYNECVFRDFASDVSARILECIHIMRQDNRLHEDMDLKNAIQIFVHVGYHSGENDTMCMYNKYIMTPYITRATAYYSSVLESYHCTCHEYLNTVQRLVEHELSICKYYMHYTTCDAVRKTILASVLTSVFDRFFVHQNALGAYIDTDNTECLQLIFDMYSIFDVYINSIAHIFFEHVKRDGSANAASNVHHLLNMYTKYNHIVRSCFRGSVVFERAMRDAFKAFINVDYKVTSLLSEFSHNILKKGGRFESDDTIDSTLYTVVQLYDYIRDKDVFENEYQSYLSTRLLTDTSRSDTLEHKVISLFKAKCGYQWSSRLEGMFKDVTASKDIMLKSSSNIFCPRVLTPIYWPALVHVPFSIPKALEANVCAFTKHYTDVYTGRKINIYITHGTADLRVCFNANTTKELVVTSIMMVIMLLFNEGHVYTYKDILNKTNIPSSIICNHLLSLANPKLKVLIKTPLKKEVCDTDTFTLNSEFKHQLYRITVPLMRETAQASTDAPKDLFNERKHSVDACIVRIMKARRSVSFTELQSEAIKQLSCRFMPDTKLVKARVEYLIEQDYIERGKDNHNILNYIA